MARIDISQADVLVFLRDALRNALALDDRTCFIALDSHLTAPPPSGDLFVTIVPGASTFDSELQIGGGQQQLTEEWHLTITFYCRGRLDQSGHADAILLEDARGLYVAKRKVLQALVAEDLADESGDTFLRQLTPVVSCSEPDWDKDRQIAWMSLGFTLQWDWDLT